MSKVINYSPVGVCSKQMLIEVAGSKIVDVKIVGGCPGNTKAVCNLCKGRNVDEVISLLRGIPCGNRNTSCPDQLACALEIYKKNCS